MIALIKNDKHGLDVLCPIPEWVDMNAFSIFSCYGYSLCENYIPGPEGSVPRFEFREREISNPYRKDPEDPVTVKQRIAIQI